MNITLLKIWRVCVVIIVAALIGWAIYAGNAWVPAPMIAAGIVITWLIRRGGEKPKTDERTYIVAYKASLFVFRIFTLVAAAVAVTLLALARGNYPELEPAGMTMAYSCCALIILYYAAFIYYNMKHGGKE